jgi:hypothetical protein
MIVRPKELANLCSIFGSIRARSISSEELKRFVRSSMLLDSYASVDEIIAESLKSGLIKFDSERYIPSKMGLLLGKRQETPTSEISENAREFFVKNILFSMESNEWCCSQFLLQFHVDTVLGTFVYDRNEKELEQDTRWLMILSDAGVIEVNQERAFINTCYLGITNDFLMRIRNPLVMPAIENNDENNKIGALAEDLALKYEKDRLSSNTYPSLAQLVQQISKVDTSAGYDILSFKGTKESPDSNVLIEVKGTKAKELRFIWSYNERRVAEKENSRYLIYGYTNVDLDAQRADGPIIIENPHNNLGKLGYLLVPQDVYVFKKI